MTHQSLQGRALPVGESEAPAGFASSRPSRVRFKHLVSDPDLTGARGGYIPPPPRVPRHLEAQPVADDELPPTRTDLPAARNCGK